MNPSPDTIEQVPDTNANYLRFIATDIASHEDDAARLNRIADLLEALSRNIQDTGVTPDMILAGATAYYDCVPVSTLSPECVADTITATFLAMQRTQNGEF